MDNRPIGVFDSGLGGLTVVRQLLRELPGEDICYFGDTGRVPYGTRSRETIEKYARQDCRFLMGMDVKMIIAACGTVSSVAPHVLAGLPAARHRGCGARRVRRGPGHPQRADWGDRHPCHHPLRRLSTMAVAGGCPVCRYFKSPARSLFRWWKTAGLIGRIR